MSIASTNERDNRLAAFLYKYENRGIIGGPGKKKYWFVLSLDSPYLYWYKNSEDLNCVGRLLLTGAAFTFDPRQIGRFEIHVNEEIHILEASDNKARIKWLQMLQKNRRKHYEMSENVEEILNSEIVSLTSYSTILEEVEQKPTSSSNPENVTLFEEMSKSKQNQEEKDGQDSEEDANNSIFYLDANGELNRKSLEIPPSIQTNKVIKTADEIIGRISEESQKVRNLEETSKKVIGKARVSLRMPSFSTSTSQKSCDQCKELLKVIEDLKNRCYELTDTVTMQDEQISALKQGMIAAHNQRDALLKLENSTDQEKLDFTLERESKITALHLANAEFKRANQSLKEQLRKVESDNESLLASVEAFRESVRTKDEIIVKICEQQSDLENKVLKSPATLEVEDFEVPEGILVDLGTSPDDGSRKIFDEAEVDDIVQLRDTVQGYKSQNDHMNTEILDLQKIVQSLEDRERKLIRQNFDIEACYYQLKSRYMMILNHFKSDTPRKPLEPSVIQELIDDVNHHQLRKFAQKPDDFFDELGFYLSKPEPKDPRSSKAEPESSTDNVVMRAADMKKRSDDILTNIQMEQSKDYLDWLQKWDSFLVNHVLQPMKQSDELKALVRTGIPHTYREKVWKRLVTFLVANTMADTGKGYYEMLTRRASKMMETNPEDASLRQIQLDLGRTLPNNIHFNNLTSQKMKSLKNVLSAYRFHNRTVEYCQGLNRIAAIGLLYLTKESDAFWFLAAVVEHLQPPHYYSSSLIGARADQKILFRFALALLKVCEPKILECSSVGAIHACLSDMSSLDVDYKTLAKVAFTQLNPFPSKAIENKRQYYLNQLKPR